MFDESDDNLDHLNKALKKGYDDVSVADCIIEAIKRINKDQFGFFTPDYVVYSSLTGKYIDARTGEEWKPEEEQENE